MPMRCACRWCDRGMTLGALHAYLQRGRFRQTDFDFSISLANIMVVALVRARQRTSLETDYRRLMDQSSGHSEARSAIARR